MIPFGVNIRLLRRARKLSQDEMQDILGVSRSTWSNYETGHTEPDFAIILRISEFFRISIDVLLKVNLYKEQEKGKPIDFFIDKSFDEIGKVIGKEIGNVMGNSNPKQLREENEKKGEKIKELEKELSRKDKFIDALEGQIEALKTATVHMSARLDDFEGKKKKSGQH